MGKSGEINKVTRGGEGVRGEEKRRVESGVGRRICQIMKKNMPIMKKNMSNYEEEYVNI